MAKKRPRNKQNTGAKGQPGGGEFLAGTLEKGVTKVYKNKKNKNGLPDALQKYWSQRYRLFSLYDEGIKIDEEGWYSVTPEAIAYDTALRLQCDVIVDAFCGVGGNSIQFANVCERVIAIDISEERLALARHNAKVYGVSDRIEFIVGDFFKLAPRLKADAVFLSPPWGGPKYIDSSTYSLDMMLPRPGKDIFEVATGISQNICLFLPRNSNPKEIIELAGSGGHCEIEQNYYRGKLKSITAYYGDLATDH
ncbi:RNA methylase protein [Mycoemilia scoparia]|uniref:Trimethylguanosine synthase n=1 Tax=Mycoemilia scoparia TaxID=417184 RepID=A0A9W8DV29_9FUNG|nr:RNA methylase protein [Mycoemilia scoparia]